ncbi:adenosylcobinamide-GDP ribazoletransferase [Neptunomonas qingdaonensis]|uniref:Adenosylcobinamide-GDP ribazoletransferase n=1 Tax=Neptunomonas qingdaonensis TaxID=1045558 RepID=A0A1I2W5V0_9GAMM|nr:adenosylcobinamide-GDP ribazoletransferase [Neptunomonas qingdaonensis]SFG96029.1 cobalamin-5'-phosphate synthase [Neptunomonas qingdaonensis]
MMKVLNQQWQAFCIAAQFLTQIPVHLKRSPCARLQGQSLLYYPLVGMFIGLALTMLAWMLNGQSNFIQATLVLILWVLLTGGLHLDGLADSADGWMGGLGDQQRTLVIMKDPCIGAIGSLTLILHLLLKWSALITLLAANQLLAILIAPLVARLAVILLLAITPYVRAQGIASPMVEYMPKQGVYLLAVSGAVLLAGLSIVWLGVVAVLFVLARRAMLLRIKGTTGDTAGALIELLEAGVLIAACFTLEI